MNLRTYTAAGGIVRDDGGRVLLIARDVFRNGTEQYEVRLPKGHVEAGETDEEAARREVCEETGYCGLAVDADLGTGITQFILNGEFVRRTEHYFLMHLTTVERGQPHFDSPEAEEARFQPLWVADLASAEQTLTFEQEQRFIRRAIALFAPPAAEEPSQQP